MVWLLRKCTRCGIYTFQETCPRCGAPTRVPHPPRFSPEDKYVRYRLEAKGLLRRKTTSGERGGEG